MTQSTTTSAIAAAAAAATAAGLKRTQPRQSAQKKGLRRKPGSSTLKMRQRTAATTASAAAAPGVEVAARHRAASAPAAQTRLMLCLPRVSYLVAAGAASSAKYASYAGAGPVAPLGLTRRARETGTCAQHAREGSSRGARGPSGRRHPRRGYRTQNPAPVPATAATAMGRRPARGNETWSLPIAMRLPPRGPWTEARRRRQPAPDAEDDQGDWATPGSSAGDAVSRTLTTAGDAAPLSRSRKVTRRRTTGPWAGWHGKLQTNQPSARRRAAPSLRVAPAAQVPR